MEKSQINSLKMQWFFNDSFQKKWQNYKTAFGEDLDGLFADDYDKKLRLSSGLEHLINNRLFDAYNELRHFESSCTTDTERAVLRRLLSICENEKEMARVKVGDWITQSGRGYYRVVKLIPNGAVIKSAFDHKLVYAKQSVNVDGFDIELTDLKYYQFVEGKELETIREFFECDPCEEEDFLCYTDTMLSLREKILKANFKEAEWEFRQFCFYRMTLENVAFIVNLTDHGDRICVTYGFTTVAAYDRMKHYGEDNDDIKLRFSLEIRDEQDYITAENAVKNVYDTYLNVTKDELLALKKDRQKQFLKRIAEKLKPLGFKKKGTKWTRLLTDDFLLEFEAQKSQWSDEYYFNVSVYPEDDRYSRCYETRLKTNGKDIYNWQLMTDAELECLLNMAVENYLSPIINTPLAELGQKKDIWLGCICQRNKCASCWVFQNLWEAKGIDH